MLQNFTLLALLSIITVTAQAQNESIPALNMGDPAPPLRVREWVKGTPVRTLDKGKVYVVEFWATWCKPCVAAMPHLSALAAKYKGKVEILGIDVQEIGIGITEKVKAFVERMGQQMNYAVATDDNDFMKTAWLDASGSSAIPQSFVVNAEGKLAWIGHPKYLDEILAKVVNNTWDIKEAMAKRNLERQLEKMDYEANAELYAYRGDPHKADYFGRPDSALLMIDEIVRKEPRLKYAHTIASHTFSALLKTNWRKAYEYGKLAMVTQVYGEPAYEAIIGTINWYSGKLNIPPEIYQLGAEAYQARIDHNPYIDASDISLYYFRMAEWYSRANNKLKAMITQQKAIEALKSKQAAEMAEFEFRLQQYQKM